jgi:hypothetical protein
MKTKKVAVAKPIRIAPAKDFKFQTADLSVLKPKLQSFVKQRCGEFVIADGLECPHCGALETYKNGNDPDDVDSWVFMIRAFRVDHSSECKNCNRWFG